MVNKNAFLSFFFFFFFFYLGDFAFPNILVFQLDFPHILLTKHLAQMQKLPRYIMLCSMSYRYLNPYKPSVSFWDLGKQCRPRSDAAERGKQCRPRSDAAERGVSSGSVVVPYCSCCLCLYFGSSIMLVTYFVNFR